jgi:proteic killer suppression protein
MPDHVHILLQTGTPPITTVMPAERKKRATAATISLTDVTFWVTLGDMIKSFKHKGLEEFFYTGSKKGIKPEQANRLERILDRLNAASEIKDMNYPGAFLHQLSGDKKGFYAVKVSGNWRIFFQFIDGDAYVVDYDDYH